MNKERRAALRLRNTAICQHYEAGSKLSETAAKFGLGRQRTFEILRDGGVWKPYVKSGRDEFLGVQVSKETKDALPALAEKEGLSVSKFVSGKLDQIVAKEKI